jgi:hypothetical protein
MDTFHNGHFNFIILFLRSCQKLPSLSWETDSCSASRGHFPPLLNPKGSVAVQPASNPGYALVPTHGWL